MKLIFKTMWNYGSLNAASQFLMIYYAMHRRVIYTKETAV